MSDFSLIDIKRAYIAGIIDGEGAILLSKAAPRGNEMNCIVKLSMLKGKGQHGERERERKERERKEWGALTR